jgi:type IV secretion system protein TrbL
MENILMDSGLNGVTKQFLDSFLAFAHQLSGAAMHLAYMLAVLSVIISMTVMLMQGENLSKVIAKLLQTFFLFGVFFTLILNCGQWIPAIINSFMQLGGEASKLDSLSPDSVFLVGTNIAGSIFASINKIGMWHVPTALLAITCAFFVFIIYCLITAEVVVNLVKSYALVSVAPIMFALGNSDFTRSTVTNYLRKVIGMGVHLMMLYIIVGIGKSLGDHWIKLFENTDNTSSFVLSTILPVLGGLIVLYLVMKNIPAFIAEISGASGFRNYGDATIAATAAGAASLTNALSKGARGVGIAGQGAGAAYAGGSAGRQTAKQAAENYFSKKAFSSSLNNNEGQGVKTRHLFSKEAAKLMAKKVAGGAVSVGVGAATQISGIAGGTAGGASSVGREAGKAVVNKLKPHFTGKK